MGHPIPFIARRQRSNILNLNRKIHPATQWAFQGERRAGCSMLLLCTAHMG
jgi:hypothetical protein